MSVQTAVSKTGAPAPQLGQASVLAPWRAGLWRLHLPNRDAVIAGVTDRAGNLEAVRASLPFATDVIQAEQVHGTSVAALESTASLAHPIPGCDALATTVPGLVLAIRTADCLPLFLWDPVQQVVGLAHVGWRGLANHLPMRMVSFVRQRYRSQPAHLWIGIGPAIRACCYAVGPEFAQRFGPFLREANGLRMCDLVACAIEQLLSVGVRPAHLLDTGQCTACHPDQWYSVRKAGDATGRMVSFIAIRPLSR